MHNDFLELLRPVAVDYAAFCETAVSLPWVALDEQHERWPSGYPLGLLLSAFSFPEGYVQKHLPQAYIRAVLSSMAFSEEWDRDFWNISPQERRQCLTLGRALYEEYAIQRESRLVVRSGAYLAGEIESFCGEHPMPEDRRARYLGPLRGAQVVELGGFGAGDYTYLAVNGDFVLLVSCGFWD